LGDTDRAAAGFFISTSAVAGSSHQHFFSLSSEPSQVKPCRVALANRLGELRMPPSFPITVMQPDDYDAVLALWQRCEGVGLTPSDSREAVKSFLLRNPGLSFAARHSDEIVSAVLCRHDGRRGYLYHLAVAPEHRHHGLGQAIVNECLTHLASVGIQKATIFVYGHNDTGQQFWRTVGWKDRTDLVVLQKETLLATTS
jgi:N-acetylglutamate synthase